MIFASGVTASSLNCFTASAQNGILSLSPFSALELRRVNTQDGKPCPLADQGHCQSLVPSLRCILRRSSQCFHLFPHTLLFLFRTPLSALFLCLSGDLAVPTPRTVRSQGSPSSTTSCIYTLSSVHTLTDSQNLPACLRGSLPLSQVQVL
uniref:Uncharacterized protein n=1 Tax=Pipistrellus kuhlii TaxID=59472 RepID=A0A7J7YNL2_PIPKU|nr:hypothetical protein mPipKuh1_010087 [Pipistrellus kuhlii]